MKKVYILLVFLISASVAQAATWYVFVDGNWNNPNTWTLDASTAPILNNPSNLIPTAGDQVIIYAGKRVDVQAATVISINSIEVNGVLNLGTSAGHNFTIINGDGRITLEGNDPGTGLELNFPAGVTNSSIGFGDAANGGTLEVLGTSSFSFNEALTSANNRPLNNLKINRQNATDKVIILEDLNLNGDLELTRGDLQINVDDPDPLIIYPRLFIEVRSNVTVSATGSMSVGTGNAFNNLEGGTYGDYHRSFNTLQLGGDFVNLGSIRFTNQAQPDFNDVTTTGAVSLVFNGATNNVFECQGLTDLYNLVVDKGTDQTYELEVNAAQRNSFSLFGVIDRPNNTSGGNQAHPEQQKALYIANGTLRLTGEVYIPTLNEGGRDYEIGERGALILDGPNVFVQQTANNITDFASAGLSFTSPNGVNNGNGSQSFTLFGRVQVNDGYFRVSEGNNAVSLLFREASPGVVEVNGGLFEANQFTFSGTASSSGVYGVVINGGILRVNGGSVLRNGQATFHLPFVDNVFAMTGGVLEVLDATGAGGLLINASQNNINVSGGVVRLRTNDNSRFRINSSAPLYNLELTNAEANGANTNARFFLENIDDGTNDIAAKDLKVLNDLTIETSTTRTTGGNTYGAYLDLCPTGVCQNLEVGGDLTIEDSAVLDVFSGDTATPGNANSAKVTFNGAQDATLYIGDITTYDNELIGYVDPEGDNTFGRYEFPFFDLSIAKSNASLFLRAKDPSVGVNPSAADLSTFKTATGGKNIANWASNLIKVVNSISISEGSTFNQIDPAIISAAYSVRLYGSEILNEGTFFIYEDGVTPKNGIIKLRTGGGDITINSSATSTIGNLRINSGGDKVFITDDLYVKRIEYRHGRLDIGSHHLKVDVLDLNLESNEVVRINNQEIFSDADMIIMGGLKSDGGLSIKVPRSIDLSFPAYDNDNIEYNNANWLWFPIGTDAGGVERYTPAICHLISQGTITGDEYINVTIVAQELGTVDRAQNGNRINYFWNVDYEGWSSGSASSSDRPTVAWMFQYDDADVIGNEGQLVPGKVEDAIDEDGDGSAFTRSSDGNGNTVRSGGAVNDNGDILGNDPRNIIIFTNNGNPNIANNTGRVFNQTGISGAWSGDWPGVGFPLSKENYTAASQNAFAGTPTIFYNRVSAGFNSNPASLPQWDDRNTWSLSGHEGGPAPGGTPYPQIGDVAIVRTRANGALVNIGITNFSAGIDVEIAQLIFTREDENGANRNGNRIFLDDDVNVDFGIVEGNAVFEIGLSAGNTPILNNTDFGNFVDNYADGSQFLFYGFSDGDLTLPSEITRYPNVRFEGNNNAALDRFFSFPADAEVLGDMTVDNRATFKVNRNIQINGNLRLAAFNQGFMQFFGDNGAIELTVNGNLQLRDVGSTDNRVLIANSASNLVHKLAVAGDIVMDAASQFDLFTDLISGDNVQLEFRPLSSSSNNWNNISGQVPELYQIIMNGALNSSFSVNTNITTPNANLTFQPIEIVNGHLIINQPDIDIIAANGSNMLVPNLNNLEASSGSGSLEILAGTVRLEGNNTGLILDGLLRVSGGTLDMATGAGNGNNFIQYGSSGNARIEVSAGSLLVGTQVRRALTSTEGVLHYNQSGGAARFGINNPPSAARGVFEVLNAGSSFVLTGGNFEIVQDNNSASVASLRLTPTTSNIALGQVIRIGTVATPANQNNFGVQSSIKLPNLTVGDFNNPTVKLYSLPLEADALVLGAGGSGNFDANGFNVTINELLNNNGTYITSGSVNNAQLTLFPTLVPAIIQGAGTTTFFNFEKNGTEELSITKDVTVTGLTTIVDGTLNTNSSAFYAEGDVIHDAIHTSVLQGTATVEEGFILNGSQKQLLSRSAAGLSTFGMLRIANVSGVEMVDSEENFAITQKLTLAAGKFEIGGNLVVFPVSSYIENATGGRTRTDFNINNMIQTNSSVRDFGVRKFFDTATDALTTFTYPVGLTNYTPVVFNRNTTNINGSITVRPVADIPPIAEDSETSGTCSDAAGDIVDSDNVLQYYWIVNTQGITNLQGGMQMYYDEGTVTATSGYTEANYGSAKLYNSDVLWFKDYDVNSVDETNNIVNFQFGGNDDVTISGIYTAGVIQDGTGLSLCGAIPDELPEFVTVTTGQNVYFNGVSFQDGIAPPPATAVDVVVRSGFTLQLDQNNIRTRQINIEAGAVLEIVSGTQNTNLGFVTGDGTIKLTVDGADALSFPAGDYSGFFPTTSCVNGGGLELAGNGSYSLPGDIPVLRRLVMSGSGTRNLPSQLRICEDLVVDGPSVENVNDRNITVDNDLFIRSGAYNAQRGVLIVRNNLTVEGGVFNHNDGGITRVFGDLDITSGTFNSGTGGFHQLYGNINYLSGDYITGLNRTFLVGTSVQTITGDFTGSSKFFQLEISNSSGIMLNNDIELDGSLRLNSGIITANGNTVLFDESSLSFPNEGRANSYVNGKVSKPLNAGQSFTFPIGSANRWRPASLNNVNGGFTWEAQFFATDVVANTIVDDMSTSDPLIATIQQGEYYVISDNPSGGVASSVELFWGIETDVSTDPGDFDKLRVMVYNTGTSEWDNRGGVLPVGTPIAGSIRSSASVSFSERIFVLGSTISNNPLPVELMYFRANNTRNSVELEWQTASEFNNDFFEVQRSFDGKNFEVIGIVEGNGTINQTINYDYSDYSPLAGDSYYRLRQVDFNGDFEYSPVAKVSRVEQTNLMLVPNPTTERAVHLRLSGFHGEQKVHVKVYDVTGKLFYSGVHEPLDLQQNALPIMNEMRPGIYMVEVVQGNTTKQVRLAIR